MVRWTPRQLMAVGLGLPFALLRPALYGIEHGALPFAFTWIGVLVAAWVGGLWPTLVVSLAGLAVGNHILVEAGKAPLGPGGVLFYTLFMLVLAVPAELYHRISRRRRADQQLLADMGQRLQRAARLNAMGELAGTLAHELNQPLTAIASYAEAARLVLARQPGDSERAAGLLVKILGQTERARGIITRIRGQVSGEALDLKPQSLREMAEEATEVALARARDALDLRLNLDRSADRVLADRIQVEQVMINLVRNAAEAMAGSPTRELRIGSAPAGDGFVECYVADRGPGIAPEVQERLFQPFASDKAEGMGVGLAVSRTIVEGHGGRIWAEPNPGGGAIFRFTLRSAVGGAA
jgi:C4-dicarboxylate-specific signal transduction histidine kinase